MRNLMCVLIGFVATGCAMNTPRLMPDAARSKVYTMSSKLEKGPLFDRVQKWTATNGGEIRLNDRAAGNIVIRANTPCDAVKLGNGYASSQRVTFVMDLQVDSKKVTLTFSNVVAITTETAWDSGMRPAAPVEMEAVVTQCLDPISKSIESSIN